MPSLLDLSLIFRWQLNDEIFNAFLNVLNKKPLRRLKILWERQEWKPEICPLFSTCLLSMSYLEDLHLLIRSHFEKNHEIDELIKVLPKMNQLKGLTLILDENKLTADNLKNLGSSIETLVKLERITISAQKNNSLKDGVVPLSKSIAKCPKLTLISVDFQTCAVTFEDYTQLYDAIINNTEHLRSLSISI